MNGLKFFISSLFFAYLVASVAALIAGCLEQNSMYGLGCTKYENFTTVFPSYKIGCWLGQEKL